ncbi:MAG: hypothetical protein SFV15_19690 [Polyangiaceae bacterium]|nr:hypothetical protein [Polyangiaceae bacterium]
MADATFRDRAIGGPFLIAVALIATACGGRAESDGQAATNAVPTSPASPPTLVAPAMSGSPALPRPIDLKQVQFSKVVAGKLGYFCGIEMSGAPGTTAGTRSPSVPAGRLLCVQDEQLVKEMPGPYIDVSFNHDLAIWEYLCAVRDTGTLECGSDTDINTGITLSLPANRFTAVAVSFFNACGLDDQGKMHCWTSEVAGGTKPLEGSFGRLAVAMYHVCATQKELPVHVDCRDKTGSQRLLDSGFFDVAVYSQGGCGAGLFPVVGLICWDDASPAERVVAKGTFVQVSMNLAGQGCALSDVGLPTCWQGSDVWVPKGVSGPLHGISVGPEHTCALDAESHVKCWSGR